MAHQLVSERVREGDNAVDATAGNGHDSVFLAELVGENGRVWSYDVQEEAVQSTLRRLEATGLEGRVRVRRGCHSAIGEDLDGSIAAGMFNLGYLPGGNHEIITRPETTIDALNQVSGALRAGGIVTCVVYPGHAGGKVERRAVEAWFGVLPQEDFAVIRYGFENQRNSPPFLMAAERRS